LPDSAEGSLRYVVPYLNRLGDFLFLYARYYGTGNE
jgi:cob(I)alamin adenosyltransferase